MLDAVQICMDILEIYNLFFYLKEQFISGEKTVKSNKECL